MHEHCIKCNFCQENCSCDDFMNRCTFCKMSCCNSFCSKKCERCNKFICSQCTKVRYNSEFKICDECLRKSD